MWLRTLTILALCSLAMPAMAAAPDYDMTPLAAADVALCLSILREAADHAKHLTGADKDAVALMEKYHGVPPMPPMPDTSKGLPAPSVMAAYGASAGRVDAAISRANAVANYDETIAQKRGVKDRYDGIKDKFDEVIVSDGTGVVGEGDGPMKVSAADLARDRKRIAIDKADWILIKPHRAEYQALRKALRATDGENY